MSQSDLLCTACFITYDLKDHVPRVITKCSHTLCSLCILNSLARCQWQYFECPFDKQKISTFTLNENTFPKNYKLVGILEGNRSLKPSVTKLEDKQGEQKSMAQSGIRARLAAVETFPVIVKPKQPDPLQEKIELLQKKIFKLRKEREEGKMLNRKMFGSLRKKRKEMIELIDEINFTYVNAEKLHSEFQEDFIQFRQLKSEAESGHERLQAMDDSLLQSYYQTERVRKQLHQKEESAQDLLSRLTQLREERVQLRVEEEKLCKDGVKLVEKLEIKESEKKTVDKINAIKVGKLESVNGIALKEKEKVNLNAENLKKIRDESQIECNKLQNEMEIKSRETEQLQEQLESALKERDDVRRVYARMLLRKDTQCQMF